MRGSTVNSQMGGFNKYAEWLHNRLTSRQLILLLSLLVGILTALAAYILKWLIEEIRLLLIEGFSVNDYHWLFLVFPGIGILLTALFIKYIVRDDIGHGVTKILFAISRRQGHIKAHNCWSSVVASSITIGFGGSGRTGERGHVGDASHRIWRFCRCRVSYCPHRFSYRFHLGQIL